MLNLLLADDDRDDRFIFSIALSDLNISANLETVNNGELLMTYLSIHAYAPPDIIFLDLNMPRKTGQECLAEIKKDPLLHTIPVIIYSTSLREDVGDALYAAGAHYYIQKTGIPSLQIVLRTVITQVERKIFTRPDRDHFMFRSAKASRPGARV